MLRAKSNRVGSFALRVAYIALFALGSAAAALAQSEPPLTVPTGGTLPGRGDAIAFESWLFTPVVNAFSLYSDNLFQSPQNKISALGFGLAPSLTAQWTNGIHTTTLYGNFEHRDYPTENEINANDGRATFTQKYEALRDLTFTLTGDYTHQTISNTLTNSIPTPVTSPGTSVLPNGDTILPNGSIVSPTGQVVGQYNPGLSANGTSLVNPYDQYTGTASVNKIFNHGILTLSASVLRADYEKQSSEDYTANTFREDGSFWLGPVFYAYTDGSFTMRPSTSTTTSSNAYRAVGGIGTRQFGLFRASVYFGYQGSEQSGTAGGEVYGGKLAYYPTTDLTISAAIDETINKSSQTSLSNQALAIPGDIPTQISLSASTRTTATSLQTDYKLSTQWTAGEHLGYARIEYIDSSRLDNAWLVDTTLRYDIWRDLALTWEYRYTSVLSNAPFTSFKSNLGMMSALYKF
jgi:hypothetical protein